ncbi:efflux RND transporter periplasmic adaptor subunit [Lacrimispora amygdalina]|uniref:Efflux RND transporter periplasmic adaptor subunit n=1 Tax=Lacrimispora amygdalina TaxID=253257 RepID=A0A3E2NEU7_9FIRM|nr:efflux RND transporter periplasmic adaptor subunit [Clostridium indicum]RFZ79549.1 efflux RND transporter periplasmic adaptor subunit [Clostridium indicum]
MKKKVLLLGVSAVILIAVILIRINGMKVPVKADTLPVVETVNPEVGTIELYTSLIGTIEPETVVRISPEASGTVTQVAAKAGDMVQQGQLLCVIDTNKVQNAKNTMDNAQVTYKEAHDTLGRMSALYQSGAVSEQEYQGYVNSAKKSEIAYKQAKEEYENQVSYSNIKSPISGKIESCSIEQFDKVSTSDQIFVISGVGNKIISTSLTEKLKRRVNPGDTVTVEEDGNNMQGTISEISGMADDKTGLFKIKIQLADTNDLSTGTSVKLSLCSERADQVITVPVDSVYYENSKPYVFTYDNGTVHKIFIEAGIYDSSRLEVKGGIQKNMDVITTWSPELYEGAKASVMNSGEEIKGESKA